MSLHRLGETRSRRTPDHLLQTPDTFVWAPLPGMTGATACVHCAPALGADFAMYTVQFERNGSVGAAAGSRFVYVLKGQLQISCDSEVTRLGTGSYCLLPAGHSNVMTSVETKARAVFIEKAYVPLNGEPPPPLLSGNENEVRSTPLLGDDAVQVRSLLPSHLSCDFAVNIMEYQPGAALSMVEVHLMEHGLLMLEGEGIYRLGDSWYPVAKGDFIWMAPFCPQWFAAIGKIPAKYLIYKDWNRHPLQGAANR